MKVKKIAALAVGAAVAGATLGLASAQPQVPEIPKDFFVKDGEPNVKIVVGSEGAAMDVVSAADIAAAIGSLLYTEKEVKVSDVSVVVRKDITYDPDDIPVFNNFYPNKNQVFIVGQDSLKDVEAWWNGSAFSANYTASVWNGGTYSGTYSLELENVANYGKYDLTGELTLKGITLEEIANNEVNFKDIEDFKDMTVKINSAVLNITLAVYNWTKTVKAKDPITGVTTTKVKWTLSNVQPGAGYSISDTISKGVGEGVTLKVFDKEFPIIFVGKAISKNAIVDAADSFVYGTYHGTDFYDQGQEVEFDGYKVEILDIDIQRNKALLKITSPSGDETTDTISKDGKVHVYFGGGIAIQLLDTFVGVAGTNTVQLKVYTNLKTMKSGKEFMPGWKAEFAIDANNKVIKWFALVNEDPLEGKEIKLFDTYTIDYSGTVKTKEVGKIEYAVLKAYIYIDPIEREYKDITLTKGDEIEDTEYYIGDINVEFKPKETYIPKKLTEPITVLDTEIMEQGLENVDSNLILVGGPVVNKVAAALADDLGVPKTYDEWKEKFGTGAESAQIIYKEKCGKIGGYGVLLVAGTDREGTRAAAEALLEYISKL
ncbi:S-layer protein [Pyrococcus abyssi]|nr:S-layer protein [Pyrococcus abyssi]CCE70152.1 TPA: hypothetical protein PAB1861 [Pyrococcus abyssi GE5]